MSMFGLVSSVTLLTHSPVDRGCFAGEGGRRLGGRESESGWLLPNSQSDQSIILLLKEPCQEALIFRLLMV